MAYWQTPRPQDQPEDGLGAVLAGVAVGDERSLAKLYDLTSRRVFALALRTVGDRGAAEEAVLDVFAQVWKQAGRYDAGKGSVLAWLFAMTRTRAIDIRRSRGRHGAHETDLAHAWAIADPGGSPHDASLDAQEATRVRRALARLSADQREALVAAYFGGLSHTEVAAALGQPLGTVKTRIRSGLLALRRLLEKNGDPVS